MGQPVDSGGSACTDARQLRCLLSGKSQPEGTRFPTCRLSQTVTHDCQSAQSLCGKISDRIELLTHLLPGQRPSLLHAEKALVFFMAESMCFMAYLHIGRLKICKYSIFFCFLCFFLCVTSSEDYPKATAAYSISGLGN